MCGVATYPAKQHIARCEVIAIELESPIARHERIVFIPKAQCDGELVGDAIAVPNKPSKLPFLGRCFDKLLALARPVEESELKLREGVKQVRGGPPIESRCAAAEVKLSARARSKFRLPVVQVVVNNVRSRADLMLTVRPPHVVRSGKAPIISESGVPPLGVT